MIDYPTATNADIAKTFWFLGIRWSILVDGKDNGGRFSLMEQLMPRDSGPPPHIHPFNDELFYVLDGAMQMRVGGEDIAASPGMAVFIPRGAEHSFTVISETCRVLNTFTPAGMEQVIHSIGTPATGPGLPPADLKDDPRLLGAFANNYWGMESSVGFANGVFTKQGG